MKTNLFTYILLFLLVAGGVSATAQEEMPIVEGPNEDPVWYFNNPAGQDSPMFTNTANFSDSELVPIGTQNAAGGTNPTLSIAGLKDWFLTLLGYAVELILALALVSFLYGIFRLIFVDASNEEARNKARKFMLWGICALFVMVSVWGLVNVLKSSVFGEVPA